MPGTVIDDPVVSGDLFSLDNNEGLVHFSDEEDSEDEDKMLEPVGYQTEVWKPAKGDVGLLTFDVVKALSDHTGCTFSINSHRNEVRLDGGKLSDALARLNVMEPILVSAQKSFAMLCLTSFSPTSTILQTTMCLC